MIGAFPDARGIVADLGGGSLELVRVASGMADGASTLPLGTLRLPDYRPDQRKGMAGRAEMKQAIDKVIRKAGWDLSASPSGADNALYLVGGTWRAMAGVCDARCAAILSDPHGFERLTPPHRNWPKRWRTAKARR